MKQRCCSHNKQHQYILLTLESGRLGTAFCLLPFRWQTETDVLSGRTIATSYNSVLIHPDDAFPSTDKKAIKPKGMDSAMRQICFLQRTTSTCFAFHWRVEGVVRNCCLSHIPVVHTHSFQTDSHIHTHINIYMCVYVFPTTLACINTDGAFPKTKKLIRLQKGWL